MNNIFLTKQKNTQLRPPDGPETEVVFSLASLEWIFRYEISKLHASIVISPLDSLIELFSSMTGPLGLQTAAVTPRDVFVKNVCK